MSERLNIDEVRKRFLERGYILIESEYKNSKTKMKYLCPKHGIQTITVNNLTKGQGCNRCRYDMVSLKNSTHGKRNTSLYRIWCHMKGRCYNKNDKKYRLYGGRGIKICDEWLNDFQAFYEWAMANGYSKGLSIDRIDNNGNYEPSNCRWATKLQQSNNTRQNVLVTYNGKTQTMSQWAREMNINVTTLWRRYHRGDTGDRLFRKVGGT